MPRPDPHSPGRFSGALLRTDIVASTPKTKRLTDPVYVAQLTRHNAIIDAAYQAEPTARKVKDEGDAYFVLFKSAAEAVRAALRIQFAIATEAWEVEPLRVALAVYAADFELYERDRGKLDLAGDAMNMASRLHAKAGPSQLLLNRAAFDQARSLLGDRLDPRVGGPEGPSCKIRWKNHGPCTFKGDIDPATSEQQTQEVCEAGIEGIGPFTPPKAATVAARTVTGPTTVPTPSPTFVPRKNITAAIHDKLRATSEAAVIRQAVARAMGGYGKTVAAILYAHEYQSHYPAGRFMLRLESADFAQELGTLAAKLGLPVSKNPADDAAAVRDHLANATSPDGTPAASLLILDNVTSKAAWDAMLATGLVPCGACRVLITTRDDAIHPEDAIKIGRLTREEARAVYSAFCADRRNKEPDEQKQAALPEALPTNAVADAITDWLGGLAVAVAAVAAFMKLKPHIAWDVYWNGSTPAPGSTAKSVRGLKNTPVDKLPEVRSEVAAQLGLEGKPLDDHRRTLRVIDDALAGLPAAERRAVEYAALLPHDMAPASWLVALLNADAARPPADESGKPDPLHIALHDDPDDPRDPAHDVLHHLDALDVLLPGGEDGRLLSLHRLWHARVNERAETNSAERPALLDAIAAHAATRRANLVRGNDGKGRGTINHPAVLTDQSLRWELPPLAALCASLWTAGQSGPAARVGVWLAGMLRLLGRYAEGVACLQLTRENEAAVETAVGHRDLAACYSNLALIQHDQGDLPGARASIERAIEITSRHFAPDHPTLATTYSNLAAFQKYQGDLPGARASMERAIAIASKHLVPEHPDLATMSSNLATIQQDEGDLSGARASMEHAIAIGAKHFAPDHPTFAINYSNLALIQQEQRDLEGARASMERAIEIWSKHLAVDHPNFGIAYSNLARIQQDQGDLPGARASMERAIEIGAKHFAPDHPTFAISYNNLAHICLDEHDHAAACAHFKKALAILLKHFDENHPNVKIVRESMQGVGCDT